MFRSGVPPGFSDECFIEGLSAEQVETHKNNERRVLTTLFRETKDEDGKLPTESEIDETVKLLMGETINRVLVRNFLTGKTKNAICLAKSIIEDPVRKERYLAIATEMGLDV